MSLRNFFIFIFISATNLLFSQTESREQKNVSEKIKQILSEGRLGKADLTIEQIQEVCNTSSDILDTSTINELNRYALWAFEQNQLDKAKDFYSLAIKQASKQNFFQGLALGYYLKGEYELQTGSTDLGINDLYRARYYYKLTNDTVAALNLLKEVSDAYYIKGDGATAQVLLRAGGEDMRFMHMDYILFFGLYIGALIFCLVYNIFLYRFTLDPCYRELAKCMFSFIVFIYTTNNDFAKQFSQNLFHYSVIEIFKNMSIIMATYYFATFLEFLLATNREVLGKFYRFMSVYKKIILVWGTLSIAFLILFIVKNNNNEYLFTQSFLLWFGLNDLIGLTLSILLFTLLYIYTRKEKIKLNYLFYGFGLNVVFLSLSATQAILNDHFSHIPYPAAMGSVLFLIFMTVAVTDKINLYKKEKEQAQENALTHLEKLVAERTDTLLQQKTVIEEKQAEIIDSINYAKRLQQAILLSEQDLNKHFAEAFVLYKPKDIVSGDFYWFSESEKNKILAVADCTGHGVPGGFMCMLGFESLQDVALRKEIETTSSALTSLDTKITETLNKSDRSYRDGMDIALCAFDKNRNMLMFSGANRPLIRISDGEIMEYKATKHSIGGNIDRTEKIYTTVEIEYRSGDIFYLFTDGFADQFGGPKGKKFKQKNLKELLLSISKLTLQEQSLIIQNKFSEWRGDLEQVDDVCVIGIKV